MLSLSDRAACCGIEPFRTLSRKILYQRLVAIPEPKILAQKWFYNVHSGERGIPVAVGNGSVEPVSAQPPNDKIEAKQTPLSVESSI